MKLLRLRCLRCGDPYTPAKDDPYEHGICLSCFSKWCAMDPGSPAFIRFGHRLRRNAVNHPTYKALSAALDALESTPHGTLVEVGDGG